MKLSIGVPWRKFSLTIMVMAALFVVACGASEAPAEQPAAPQAETSQPQQPETQMEQPTQAPAVPTDARALTDTRQFESTPTPEPAMAAATATPGSHAHPGRCIYRQRYNYPGDPGRTHFPGNFQRRLQR